MAASVQAATGREGGAARVRAARAFLLSPAETRELLADSHFALAASGTVTLETAYFGVPMVVFYRVNRLHKALLGWLMRTKYYSLVNILAGRELVPELMPWYGRPDDLSQAVLGQLADPRRLAGTSQSLRRLAEPLREPLGMPAAEATAELVVQTMNKA